MKSFANHAGRRPKEVAVMKGQLMQEFKNFKYCVYAKVVEVGAVKPKQDGKGSHLVNVFN